MWNPSWLQYEWSNANVFLLCVSSLTSQMVVDLPFISMHSCAPRSASLRGRNIMAGACAAARTAG